jgi:hypothetical protein
MQLPVVTTAQWYREFIADFQTNAARLRKSKMMRVAWLSSADQTRLGCDKLEMRFVTQPLGLGDGELALVDLGDFPFGARTGVPPLRWTSDR